MADADRERWNQRHGERTYDFTPSDWLVGLGPRLQPRRPGARALDLACGGGRNTLFLARLGYHVDAWDISDRALGILGAELERLRRDGQPPPVRVRQVDLDSPALPEATYDLVLDAYFLERSLFPAMIAALRPGGLVLIHTFLRVPGKHATLDPTYLLVPGELRAAFSDLEALDDREDLERGEARLLARKQGATLLGV